MNFNNEDDVLALIRRLLERLQQADGEDHKGSHISFVYVASGAQHVDTVQNQYFGDRPPALACGRSAPGPAPHRDGKLPEVLATEEAMRLWEKAQRAGYVDDDYQPRVSRTKAAMIANAMAVRLGIRNKWKAFETSWHRQNMYQDYYDAVNQQQSIDFQDSLDAVFG